MKIIKDFNNFSSISGNAASGYPLDNLKTLDSNEIWKATHNSETITVDFGSAKPVSGIFLNNTNFLSAAITASNNSDFSGGITTNLSLKRDDLGIIKGFTGITSGNYRYVRIVCSNLVCGSVIQMGNLIIGKAEDIKVSSWNVNIADKIKIFESDGGSYRYKTSGQSRHSFDVGFTDPKSVIDNLPLDFEHGVIFTDLDDVSDSYIIGRPTQRRKTISNPLDCSLNMKLEELI